MGDHYPAHPDLSCQHPDDVEFSPEKESVFMDNHSAFALAIGIGMVGMAIHGMIDKILLKLFVTGYPDDGIAGSKFVLFPLFI